MPLFWWKSQIPGLLYKVFSWFDVGCATRISVGFTSLTEHFSRRPFPPISWFSSHFCIWISPLSQPPSKLQLPIPPSFSPCLLSFLPPAQTSSQTQGVDGNYDWILPWLQIMCEAAGKRGTAKNRGRQREGAHTCLWEVCLNGCS